MLSANISKKASKESKEKESNEVRIRDNEPCLDRDDLGIKLLDALKETHQGVVEPMVPKETENADITLSISTKGINMAQDKDKQM